MTPTPALPADAGSGAAVLDAAYFRRWLAEADRLVRRDGARLTELDAVIGDGDHGANLVRGFGAVRAAVAEADPRTPGALLTLAGNTLTNTVGGASGPLFGTTLRRTGKVLGEDPAVSLAALAEALTAGLRSVRRLGGAEPGDATMVDALDPAVTALTTASGEGLPLREALDLAVAEARSGADATGPLQARKGRASYLGERSIGHQDAGANSLALLVEALRTAVDAGPEEEPPAPAAIPEPAPAPARETPPTTSTAPAAPGVSGGSAGRVGVVLVSHSKAVAESTAELALALLGSAEPAAVVPAGGTADGSVGTSAELVRAAAARVDGGAGVAVLCDMGSAVLTVQALLGDPDGGLPGDTRIVDAPFLEGAVAIVLTASVGGDMAAVLAAAEDARLYRKG